MLLKHNFQQQKPKYQSTFTLLNICDAKYRQFYILPNIKQYKDK